MPLQHIVQFPLEPSPLNTVGEEGLSIGLGRQVGQRLGDVADRTGPGVAGVADAGLGPVSLGLADQVPPIIRVPPPPGRPVGQAGRPGWAPVSMPSTVNVSSGFDSSLSFLMGFSTPGLRVL